MAIVSLPTISGDSVKEIVNAIEKQRKEMEFLLMNLDDQNILKLSGKKVVVGGSTIDIQMDSINLSVAGLNDRMESAETSLTLNAEAISLKASTADVNAQFEVQAGQISSKVSSTDYTGDVIASLITQAADRISISAQAIDLNGITRVNGTLYVGDGGSDSWKTLWFTDASCNISATGFGNDGLSEIQLNASTVTMAQADYLNFRTGTNDLPTYVFGKLDFGNATITNLNVTVSFG